MFLQFDGAYYDVNTIIKIEAVGRGFSNGTRLTIRADATHNNLVIVDDKVEDVVTAVQLAREISNYAGH